MEHTAICSIWGVVIQLNHIHFQTLLARCTEMDRMNWPLFTRLVSQLLFKNR
jgi:hypothetical protein